MDYISHHGILGMKWGIRRTPQQLGHTTKSKEESKARKEAKDQKKKDVKNRRTLSDKQLKDKLERLRMEKQLRELTEQEISPGKTAVKDILNKVGKTAVTGAALYGMKALISKEFDPKELGSAIFNGGPKKK